MEKQMEVLEKEMKLLDEEMKILMELDRFLREVKEIELYILHIHDSIFEVIKMNSNFNKSPYDHEKFKEIEKLVDANILQISSLQLPKKIKNKVRFEILKLVNIRNEFGFIKTHKIANAFAALTNIDERYARMYKQIYNEGSEEIKAGVLEGRLTISKAALLSGSSEENYEDIYNKIDKNKLSKSFNNCGVYANLIVVQ